MGVGWGASTRAIERSSCGWWQISSNWVTQTSRSLFSVSVHCLSIHLSIFQCRMSRKSLAVPRGKRDPSWFGTQEVPNLSRQETLQSQGPKSPGLLDFIAPPIFPWEEQQMLMPAACFPQKSLWVHPQGSAPHGSTIWFLKISLWRGKGTLVCLRKLCSQINEQLKQNQIMVPAEITPLLSNTFTRTCLEDSNIIIITMAGI